MAKGRKSELMPWPADLASAMAKKYGYSQGAFPKTTYPDAQSAEVPTIIMATTLMTSADVPDDTIYKVTKTLCENTAEPPKIHASMDVFDCKTAIKTQPIPVHPGAAKYYKEKGLM
jgi:TRAP transporter TAXI family solute receptor